MRKHHFLIVLLIAVFYSCQPHAPEPLVQEDAFPAAPVNLGDINSIYDDYNSNLTVLGDMISLVFSSNRYSGGTHFDFVMKLMNISQINSSPANIQVLDPSSISAGGYAKYKNIEQVLAVNSFADELGPYLLNVNYRKPMSNPYFDTAQKKYAFLYATNPNGNLDIRYIEETSTGKFGNARDIGFLNSPKDDAYPCVMSDTSSVSAIYFCSNRDGNFDIFKADFPTTLNNFVGVLQQDGARTITRDMVLSSAYEDKCPFIMGKLLVFASNRPGGFGGFDLYYSKLVNGQWSTPVNFGEKINSAKDEYRPVILTDAEVFSNNLMLFSSNRPGGKGGFDLYYVGIEKMTR